MRRRIGMIAAAACLVAAGEPPSENGDGIGVATRERGGRLVVQLRSVQCDGMIAESRFEIAPTDADYAPTMKWLGGIRPGETKTIRARDLKPCDPR